MRVLWSVVRAHELLMQDGAGRLGCSWLPLLFDIAAACGGFVEKLIC